MSIPKHSEYTKEYKAIKKLVGRFIKMDDEIRYPEKSIDIGASMDDHQLIGEELIRSINRLMRVSA